VTDKKANLISSVQTIDAYRVTLQMLKGTSICQAGKVTNKMLIIGIWVQLNFIINEVLVQIYGQNKFK